MLIDLFAGAGEWRGTNTLHDPEMGMQPVTTDSSAAVTPLLDGRFVRIDYTWSYKGTPQSGSMLIGHQRKAGRVTIRLSKHTTRKPEVRPFASRDANDLTSAATVRLDGTPL